MRKLAAATVLVFAVWLTLTADLSLSTIIAGVMVSIGSVYVVRELIRNDRWLGRPEVLQRGAEPRRTIGRALRLGFNLIGFGFVFLWKVLLSGVNIAFLALKPSLDFWPGIVRVHGGMKTVSGTTFFANILTLTPGTLTIDYDEEGDDLYVHWIDVTGYGEADFDRRVTSGLRDWLRRIDA